MKKTILVTILVAVMLLAALATTVNAGSVTVSESTVKENETVVVTIRTDAKQKNTELNLKYDPEKFEYVETSTTLTEAKRIITDYAADTIRFVLADSDESHATNTLQVTFRAKAEVENAKFEVSDYVNTTDETLDNTSVTVTVVKDTTEEPDNNTEEPGDNNTEEPGDNNTEKPGNNNNNPTDINGKPINKHPQTGTPLYIGAIAVIVMALGTMFVVKKSK